MTRYVALLRAVNVGGTGKLPMTELRAMCEGCSFKDVRTYVASGNVVFKANLDEAAVQAKLEAALQSYAGKPVGVAVRTGAEMAAVLAANPFGAAAPNRIVAISSIRRRLRTCSTGSQVRPARKSSPASERSTSTTPTAR
jgi:uncharacterized protein (DUF1697 family)